MESDSATQQAFALGAPPASPATAIHPPSTAASTTPHLVQLTPSQAEALAELGLLSNNPPFTPDSVVSPQSPAYSQHSNDMNGGVATLSSPYYAGTPGGGESVGLNGSRMVPRALNMDIDMNSFPPSPHSASGSSTGATTPAMNPLRAPYYYSPAGSPAHATHPAVQRHHPYAHPAHPPRPSMHSSQGPSSSAIPLYLAPPSIPPTTPTSSASDVPPSALPSASNGVFPTAVPDPVPRVQSAPAHIEGDGEMHETGTGLCYPGSSAQEWDPSIGAPLIGGGQATPLANGEWAMDQPGGRSRQATLGKADEPGFFDSSFSYTQGQAAFTQQQQQQQQQPPSQVAPQQLAPPPSAIQLTDVVAAIALLRNRLPIMEAALSTSVSDPGGDEEEIWKGVEGAYGELRRIMMSRKEARRNVLSRSGTLKAAPPNRAYSMDLETPSTPVDNRPLTTAAFLNAHAHPPLLHSQSSPDVPTVNAQMNAQRAAHAQAQQQAAQAQAANQQAMQRQHAAIQHAQMQQAQMVQMQQAEAHARAEAQLQADVRARAEAEARARAEAEQRARAEEESRAKAEQEAQARARAEADAEAARREQQEQYEKAVAEQQHQQQAAMAHQQLQQQQHMAQLQEEHYRQQQEQHIRHQQIAEAQANSNQAQAQYQAAAHSAAQQAAQHAAQFPPSTTPQSQSTTLTPQSITNPLPPHLSLSTNVSPAQQPANVSPTSRTTTPFSLAQQTPLASQGSFAYDPNGDMSMGTVMGLHMGQAASFASAPTEGPSAPADNPTEIGSLEQMGWGNSNNYAALQAAATGVANMGLSAQASIPSPPNATTSVSSRPARSRAASGSGYVSASGSRSRAASGSGYQSLLETRSRAASSASSVFGTFERDEDDELEEDDNEHADHEEQPVKTLYAGAGTSGDEPEFKARVDPIFFDFLSELCSNLDATDAKGEPIHQTLMAKKMEKLDQSTDYRPFKFRIQAFTTAFGEKLISEGFHESEIPIKRIRQYLWAQAVISRFNDDGKKAKSKGNHIWTIEAKKLPEKKWLFREFARCIKGLPPSVAFVGLPWTWAPRVWDPQCSISPADIAFSSPALPPWLSWNDNVLSGEAPESAKGQSFEIEAVAVFIGATKSPDVRVSYPIVVASPSDNNDPTTVFPLPGQLYDAQSSLPSPSGPTPAHRSPVLSQSSFPSMSKSRHNSVTEQQRPSSSLLPSLMTSTSTSGVNSLASSLSSLDQHQQRQADQEFHDAMALQQAQQRDSDDMMVDDSVGHQQSFDSSFEAQADLHRHYTSIAVDSAPFDGPSHSALSFAPAPELVQSALRQAALSSHYPHGNSMMSVPPSASNTPGGYVNEVDGQLASFVLSNQQQQQPGNFTLDPSQL